MSPGWVLSHGSWGGRAFPSESLGDSFIILPCRALRGAESLQMRKIGERGELLIAEGHLLPQQAWPCSGFPLSLGPCGQGWVLMELEQTVGSAPDHTSQTSISQTDSSLVQWMQSLLSFSGCLLPT